MAVKNFCLADLSRDRVGTFTIDHGNEVCPIVLEIVGIEEKIFAKDKDAKPQNHLVFKDYNKTLPLSISRTIQLEDIFQKKTMLAGEKVKLVMDNFSTPKGSLFGVCIRAADAD